MLFAEGGILSWLAGNDPSRAGVPKLKWTNFPESWGVFVLIAILALIVFGVVWLYRREIKTCPMPVKLLLAGIRLSVLLLLVALFLKPSVYYQQINEIKPSVTFLRDASISFDRGDNYRDPGYVTKLAEATGLDADQISSGEVTRSKLLNSAVDKDPEFVEAIRNKGSIRVVDFADGTKSVAVVPAIARRDTDIKTESNDEEEDATDDNSTTSTGVIQDKIPPLNPDGLGTDIWQALRSALDDPNRLSAILLATDGQHNGSEDPKELALKAAELGIPIYTIGTGDPNPPKNLAVTEVYVRNKAYPDEPFEIEAMLQASRRGETGLPGQIQVNLLQQRVDPNTGKPGVAQQVQSREVSVPGNGGRIRVDFSHVLTQPGKYNYIVQTETLDDETNLDDNSKVSSQLEVVDEKVKVLLISGEASWDFIHVQRLFQRDQTISLSCWLQSQDETRPQEGDEPISQLPRTLEELGMYNVVIMMDPNPQEFDASWMKLLDDFCRFKAGGLLYVAGDKFTAEFVTMNRLKKIRDILPVRLGDTEFIDTTQALALARDKRSGKMLLVNHNMDHPVMSFKSDPQETQKIWGQMPGIQWSFPAISAKPTARVLIESGDQVNAEGNEPLIVASRYGAGSVLYMGFQSTWRWRPIGLQAQYFDRFWIQVVRYLVETRSLQGSRRGFIDTDKTEYELGDRVTLIGRMLDQQFRPSKEKLLEAMVRSEDGRTQSVQMKLIPGQAGRYEGTYVAQRTGSYEGTIKIGGSDTDSQLIEPIAFKVVTPSAESGAFWLNEKLLTDIAEQSGGKYFRLDEIKNIPQELPVLVTRAEFNSPPEPIWDLSQLLRYLTFGLPVLLLTIEWTLRKWFKLL